MLFDVPPFVERQTTLPNGLSFLEAIMFTVTTVATGNLFNLPGTDRFRNNWTASRGTPLMLGSVGVGESVMPILALLEIAAHPRAVGTKSLKLKFGSDDLRYEGELWCTDRRGWHDGELPEGENPDDPDYEGYVSLVPYVGIEHMTEDAQFRLGSLSIEGRRVRNADGSVRIALWIGSRAMEDSDQLRAGVPV
ncbi:hypothetical protein SB861_47220 [Paraburkholderia sp. SIMBA_049]